MAYGIKALVAFSRRSEFSSHVVAPNPSGSSAREPVPLQCITWCTDIEANKTPVYIK